MRNSESPPRHGIGRRGEALAAQFLEAQGYRILHRNWRKRAGEIDLIAQEGRVLVFVEVKTRRSNKYGEAMESLDEHKQRQLAQLAMLYLAENNLQQVDCRFDVVTIEYRGRTPHLSLYRNAFLPPDNTMW